MEGSLSNEGAPALIDRAKLDFRDMREVGGFVIRSDASHSNGSARFARSLTERQAEDENISRVAKHSRHGRARLN